jgi:hypothetical protein
MTKVIPDPFFNFQRRNMHKQAFKQEAVTILPYRRKESVVEADLGDEMVLLNLESRQMYSLNKTGRYIWKHLPERGLIATLAELTQTFQVGESQALQDINELIQELMQNGLFQEAKENLSFDILGCKFEGKALDQTLREWLLNHWYFLEHYHHPVPLKISLSISTEAPSSFPLYSQPQPLTLTDRQVPFFEGNPSFLGTQKTGLKMEFMDSQVKLEGWGQSHDLIPLLQLALVEALRRAEFIPLHAAVISKNDEATALIAASGIGKTTTFIQAVHSGWQPVCEDFAWLDPRSMKIYGWDKGIRLLPDTYAHFKAILKLENLSRDAYGKYYVSYAQLGWQQPSTPVLKRLIFLERDENTGWQEISQKEATPKLWSAAGFSCLGTYISITSDHLANILRSTYLAKLSLGPLEASPLKST